jgi:dienelactone hydrolase
LAAAETIVLIHSVYGLRPAVRAAADRLRAVGHEVLLPDLFDGRSTDVVEEGRAIRDEIGLEELVRRAVVFAAPRSADGLVYAGFSLGAGVAQALAMGDEHARGLLLLHGTNDVAQDAATELAVQLHVADPDPSEPDDWLNTWYLRMRRAGADVEVHRYRGAGHLYTDPDLPDWDEEAAERTWSTATSFLASL